MAPDPYANTNLVVWSEHQSELLRRMSAGERVNHLVDWHLVDWHLVDWENVAEEIESLARSDKRGLRSRITTIL